jgi:hypothetical protein
VYVIDLLKETSFQTKNVSWASYGLFHCGAGGKFRGLAYSPNIDAGRLLWFSSGKQIPTGMLACENGAVAVPKAVQFLTMKTDLPGLWSAPISLPVFETPLKFRNFNWVIDINKLIKPEKNLATGTYEMYKPEMVGSGIRWRFKGGTFNEVDYPDVYVQEWTSSAQTDSDAFKKLAPPTSTTWVVYTATPVRANDDFVEQDLLLVGSTLSNVNAGSGLPPTDDKWKGHPTLRALAFKLTAQDTTAFHPR